MKAVKPNNLEEAIEIAKAWMDDTGKPLPETQRAWAKTLRSDVPFTAHTAVKKFSILDVINHFREEKRSKPVFVETSVIEEALCIKIHKFTNKGQHTHYTCGVCEKENSTTKQALLGRMERNIVGCDFCNVIPGKAKPIEYYQQFIKEDNMQVLRIENQECIILHEPCGNEIRRGIRYIVRKSREYLVCEHCDGGALRSEGFSSKLEAHIIPKLLLEFPNLTFEREVQYSSIINTDRKFRADIYVPELRLVLEITTTGNNLPGYAENLSLKIELLKSFGISAYVVHNLKDAKDIVWTALKNAEGK